MIASYLEIYVVLLGLMMLMTDAFSKKTDKNALAIVGIIGLSMLLIASFFVIPVPASWASSGFWAGSDTFYLTDSLAMFFKRFMLLSTILTLILAMDFAPTYLRYVPAATPQAGLGEFYTLPVFTCAGLMWLVSAGDFIMIFVALELVTISFYVQVASMRKNISSLEAGVKYLILGALSTGFLVYGITWIFGLTGTTSLAEIARRLPMVTDNYHAALFFGLGLVLVGLGFKVAAVPFQFWVPDVYQGAPTPVTAYLSVASKAAGFVVLLRVLGPFLNVSALHGKVLALVTILAGATLVLGNFAAMPQTNLKRLLAYSSVAHAGYLLVGVASLGPVLGSSTISFYLFGYLLMTFLAFLVLLNVSKVTGGEEISDFNGLGRRSPVLALALLVSMLSLAGLPFTVGFLGKFFIFQSAMEAHQFWLVGLGAIAVACGFYYYLKVVRAMYWQPSAHGAAQIEVSAFGKILIFVLCAAIIVFGIFPAPILDMLR